jgi:hypothetical protein
MPEERPPETKKESRARSTRTILLLATPIAIVLLLLGAYILYRSSLARQVEARLAALRAAGLPATCAELDEWHARPPEGQNAAELYEQATKLLVARSALSTRERTPGKGIITTVFPDGDDETDSLTTSLPLGYTYGVPERDETLSPDILSAAQAYLATSQEPLRLIHEAARRPACRWQVDYSKGIEPRAPAPWARFCHLLCLEATIASRDGDGSRAIDAFESLTALGDDVASAPFVFRTGWRLTEIGVRSLEDTVSHLVLPDESLSRSIEILRNAESKISFGRSLMGERCFAVWLYEQPLDKATRDYLGYGVGYWHVGARYYIWSGGREHDLLLTLETFERLFALEAVPLPQRLDRLDDIKRWFSSQVGPARRKYVKNYVFSPVAVPHLFGNIEEEASIVARLRAARTALAVERFRLATRRLPSALAEIAPRYLPELPLDPFDGRPLRYKILEKGFALYSIGANKLDDGGVSGTDEITFTVDR